MTASARDYFCVCGYDFDFETWGLLVAAWTRCVPKDNKNDRYRYPNTDCDLRAGREVVPLNALHLRVGHGCSQSCLPVCDGKSFRAGLTDVALELRLVSQLDLHSRRLASTEF